jgi:putative oxidoreductase
METGTFVQRLFSTFPDGWPGIGLLLLRMGAAIALVYFGVAGLTEAFEPSLNAALHLIAVAGGLLLLIGLGTPVAGVVVAIDKLGDPMLSQVSRPNDRGMSLLLAVLAASVAMLGPGAWSLDARLFGRRRLEIGSDGAHRSPRRRGRDRDHRGERWHWIKGGRKA